MAMQRFNDIYFSGSQAQVILGDTILTEAVKISGVYQVPQIPIYSFAAHHFNTVSQGRVMANGLLVVNYVFDGYLLSHYLRHDQQRRRVLDAVEDSSQNGGEPEFNRGIIDPTQKDEPTRDVIKVVTQEIDDHIYGPSDAVIKEYINKFWSTGNNPYHVPDGDNIRPEFRGPFKLVIRDFRTGYLKENDANKFAEQKTFYDVYLGQYSTVRDTNEAPVQEQYHFIAKSFI